MATFNDFGLSTEVTRALSDMGFEEATPIQEQTIPTGLRGKDLIGQAQTGTGKTAAFGIPMIEQLNTQADHIQGLVLTPTRELAVQVAEELNKIGQYKGIRTLPIYGGQDINRQIRALKNRPQIIVATPGRFMDHMRRKTIRPQSVEIVVLDEADEMLNMGFIEDIETILHELPNERQTLLFSATMPKSIQTLCHRFLKDPQTIAVKAKEMTVPNIEQQYIEVSEKQKFDALCRLMDIHSPELAIIFGRTKRRVDELSEALIKRGYDAEGIHGDLSQAKRDSVMRKFKEGTIEVLVATDVAARGLDISGVTHVYNFDIPQDPESYVHRIGRTGRAGRTGVAVTFVTPREMDHLRTIEQITKRRMERRLIPSMSEAMEGQQRLTLERLLHIVEEGQFQEYRGMAEDLLNEHSSVNLLAAALKLLTKEPDTTPVVLTAEAPLRVKKARNPREGYKGYKDRSDRNNRGNRGGRGDRDRNNYDRNRRKKSDESQKPYGQKGRNKNR